MKIEKHKLFAFALSAISTGILISCVRPDDNLDSTKKDDANIKPNDGQLSSTDAKTEIKATKVNKINRNISELQPLELNNEILIAYLMHVNRDIIQVLYQNSANKSQQLYESSKKLCNSGKVNNEALKKLRADWLLMAKAWAQAEAINYGPAYDEMAHLYINYFPDERKLVHKSVVNLVKDNPTLNAEQFANESAIVQGVPALEDILYTNDYLDEGQCRYVISASAELNRRLSDIATQWKNKGDVLLGTTNPTKGMDQYFNGLLFHIENLKSTGLAKPLALNTKKKGHVPAHTAGQSREIFSAKLLVLQKSFSDPKLVELFGKDKKIIDKLILSVKDIQTQLDAMPDDITKADTDMQQALYDSMTDMTKQIKRGVMPLLGIQVGFNSTDGD